MKFRIGYGFDVHSLQEGRPFILGGVHIPSTFGPLGHSDADVLIHAICDALLGSVALGDIGQHFPDSSAEYKNIDSKLLLERVVELLHSKGWYIVNIDSTVVLEKPKIMTHIPAMRKTLAKLLKIEVDELSIKATTNEKMGYIGRMEGVCAYAVAMVQKQ